MLLLPAAPRAAGTPLIALRESGNCGGCHTPGRSQRPLLERRCTLDCQGCHADPAGGGPRNQWGYYYEQDQLTSVTFFKPKDPLEDVSYADIHYDGRIITQQQGSTSRTFPMSSELSLRVRPFVKYLSFTYQALLLGQVGDLSFEAVRSDHQRYREKYAVMVDNLPLDTYVRAYRGPPMYGLRRANHTLWIRERLGLDQFAQTEAVEAGATPNVPFVRGSLMRGDPDAAPEDRQQGTTLHAGLRGVSYGWHLNTSAWETRSAKEQISMRAVGGGLRPGPFVLMAERNWRTVTSRDTGGQAAAASSAWQTQAPQTWPSSRIDEVTAAFAGVTGVMAGGVYEELHDAGDDSRRRSVFVDLHPVPYVQFEVWRRFQSGTRQLTDTLAVAHLYADF